MSRHCLYPRLARAAHPRPRRHLRRSGLSAALAQLAALGAAVAVVAGFDLDGPAGYAAALGAAFLGAALFSFTRTRSSEVPQEAIIGVVYVVAAAASILALDRSAHGAEHLKEVLVGQIL